MASVTAKLLEELLALGDGPGTFEVNDLAVAIDTTRLLLRAPQ
jgi:hypothetical protein